jgi:hypothetical protein
MPPEKFTTMHRISSKGMQIDSMQQLHGAGYYLCDDSKNLMPVCHFVQYTPWDKILLLERLLHRSPFEQIVPRRQLNLRRFLHR